MTVPPLITYDVDHLHRISLPVGGVGTGTIGFGGRGQLRDFELGNRPAKGFRPAVCSFLLRIESAGEVSARVLEGPLADAEYDGDMGSPTANHGLPRFRSASFGSCYPFGVVALEDPDMPSVTAEAFNPFIPTDVDASSYPVAVLRYRIRNDSDAPMRASIAASFSNFIGSNGTSDDVAGNVNVYREDDTIAGIIMTAPDLPEGHEAAGSFCFATIRGAGPQSHRTAWAQRQWSNSFLEFWDDFVDDGIVGEPGQAADVLRPVASLTNECEIAPGEEGTIEFLLTWNFPNRRAWRADDFQHIHLGEYTDEVVGNHYSVQHPDVWKTASRLAGLLPALESRTRRFTEAVIETSAPHSIREAALSNLSTLRSPTVMQTANGAFWGWEGVLDRVGSCSGTCTHVWGYEFATSLLFPQIARSFREIQYLESTDERGMMTFRASQSVTGAPAWELAAADGQMATFVHLYFDFKLSGDVEALRKLWPQARRSLEFAWVPGGWDADRDGVMEGCQHNTMDVEYYGPNPQMQGWYLAALRAGEELARVLGESDFADLCRDLFERGSAWTDQNLFNGAYYEHQIVPIPDPASIATGLVSAHNRERASDPTLQLGKGVLIDQMVGQYAARFSGLGNVLEPANVRTAITHVYASNVRETMWGHFNHMRDYSLDGESAVLMASYPEGTRPEEPFPYFNEVMTGFEYTLAINHIQDGDRQTAENIIAAIRARMNGARRNPFDETECGRHYARALASWSALVAWNDVHWDGVTGTLRATVENGQTFWSTGQACGELRVSSEEVALEVFEGVLSICRLSLADREFEIAGPLAAGDRWATE